MEQEVIIISKKNMKEWKRLLRYYKIKELMEQIRESEENRKKGVSLIN